MFHVVTGLPRSGSTLLCNLLNQNPALYASSTSNLPQMMRVVSQVWSTNLETKNLLNTTPEETEMRMTQALKGLVSGWYSHLPGKVIFDKSRGWTSNVMLLSKVFPESKHICLVRDPREVFASCEKQYRNSAIVADTTENSMDRASKMFEPEGIIGGSVKAIEDLIRKKEKNVFFVQYNDLAANPSGIMQMIYAFTGISPAEHDFENVKNTADDPDGFYLNKFPHSGEGKVEPSKEKWQDFISEDIAQKIVGVCSFMGVRFGYW